MLAAQFRRAGADITIGQDADLLIDYGEARLYIECKRPLYANNIPSNVKKARRQLQYRFKTERRSGKHAELGGLVAISISKALNPGEKMYVVDNEEGLQSLGNDIMNIRRLYPDDHDRQSDFRLIGMFYHLFTPARVPSTGRLSKILKSDLFEPFIEGLRLVGAPVLALRWLLAKSVPAIISGPSSLVSSVAAFTDMLAEFVVMFAAIQFGSILLVGGIIAPAAALTIAGYELYRHWGAVKRLLSRSVDSAHKAAARLLKWLDESVGSAIPFGGALVAIKPANRNVPRFSAARAATARDMNHARGVEHAAAVVGPAPTLRAVRRAAAAAAFATPLMLTAGSVSTFTTPFISTNDTTRIAAPLSAVGMTQGPIVINYTPNVVIHSEHAADIATLKRRVMEILERHGRELHQVLAREIVRQQRTEFNSLLSNQ